MVKSTELLKVKKRKRNLEDKVEDRLLRYNQLRNEKLQKLRDAKAKQEEEFYPFTPQSPRNRRKGVNNDSK